MNITTQQLCDFFCARSSGFAGELEPREFPAATDSFAPVPCRIVSGDIPVVRDEPDEHWDSNVYEIFEIPEDNRGIVIERVSVSSTWRFIGIGGGTWTVESPEEWRVKNAFKGECEGIANSCFGPFTPEAV